MSEVLIFALIALSGALLIKKLGIIDRLRGICSVNVHKAQDLIRKRDAFVLDVRTEEEYAAGRIPEARHLPLNQIGRRYKELDSYKDRPILVSCRSGSRSAHACAYLRRRGFEEVYNLKGGLLAWARANLALES